MAPGARSKSGAPVFEFEVFRKQMYCIEESTCDIVGAFRRPHSNSAPGELSLPFPPSCYAPDRNRRDKTHFSGFGLPPIVVKYVFLALHAIIKKKC